MPGHAVMDASLPSVKQDVARLELLVADADVVHLSLSSLVRALSVFLSLWVFLCFCPPRLFLSFVRWLSLSRARALSASLCVSFCTFVIRGRFFYTFFLLADFFYQVFLLTDTRESRWLPTVLCAGAFKYIPQRIATGIR